jgi:hypothetical protein
LGEEEVEAEVVLLHSTDVLSGWARTEPFGVSEGMAVLTTATIARPLDDERTAPLALGLADKCVD